MTFTPTPKPTCKICGKSPEEIEEYIDAANESGYETPTAFVLKEEGTYNHQTEKFYCTADYIRIGMPRGTA